MKINIKEVKTIDVLYIEEDNWYEFAWVYGPIWENEYTRISKNKWHLSVF